MVLFDFDGVLANSLEVCLAACESAARQQGQSSELATDTFADLDPLTFEALAERLGLNETDFAEAVKTAVQANPVPSHPFPGIPEMIAELAKAHTLAVVSASHGDVLSAFLNANGLEPCFQHVLGGDSPGDKTTKIKSVLNGARNDGDLFVGDAVSDITAAHAAGIACCVVTWGWQPLERLLAHSPEFVAHSPAEILAIANARLFPQSGARA